MTIYAWARRRTFPDLPAPVPRYFDVAPGTRVLAQCHWQADPRARPTMVVLHGLEGSSEAHYVRGVADKAFHRGFNVLRLNQRNCGGTEHLSEGLYHSGLTSDVKAVLEELAGVDRLASIVVCGYSLGGNLALKLAGGYGDQAPAWIRAICAVSPTLELGACMDLMERLENRLYEWNFMYGLRGRIRRKARLFPRRYDVRGLWRIRTIRAFDERFTAPHNGYANADDYYYQAASMRVVDRIRVPTMIISAEDDPFIPVAELRDARVAGNPQIAVVVTRHGGHCGFVEPGSDGYDGYWAERAVVEFAAGIVDPSGRPPTRYNGSGGRPDQAIRDPKTSVT
jgi:uncharacterized protein